MQMRLGKTFVLIRYIEPIRAAAGKSILIICPNNVKGTWGDEFEDEGIEDYLIIQGDKKYKEQSLKENFDYVICNFEQVFRLQMHLYEWGAIVLDESLIIGNPKNNITKYLLTHFFHIKSKFILCGEPAPESELQYFNQMKFVFDEFMGCNDYWEFRFKYYKQVGFKWIPKAGVKKEIYIALRERCFFLTREEAGVGNKKLYRKIRIPLTKPQRKAYNEMLTLFEADGIFTKYAPVKAMFLHKIAGGSNLDLKRWHSQEKIKWIIEELKNNPKEKYIIWCKYVHEFNKIGEELHSKGIKFVRISGETPVELRDLYRKQFALDNRIQVALKTIKSSYRGTDFSSADTAIYYSNECSWDLRSQSEDRIIGWDDKPKNIVDLCTDKTTDFDIVEMLRGKKIDRKFFMSSLYQKIVDQGKI